MYLFGLTLAALILVLTKPLILVVYGPQWEDVVPYARMIVLGGTALMIRQTLRHWLIASGHSSTLSRNQIVTAAIAVPMILFGAWYGLIGVTVGTTLACVVESALLWIGNRERTHLPRGGWFITFWRPISVSVIVGAGLVLLNRVFPIGIEPIVRMVGDVLFRPYLTSEGFESVMTWFVPFAHLSIGLTVAGLIWIVAVYVLMPGEIEFLERMLGIRWRRSNHD